MKNLVDSCLNFKISCKKVVAHHGKKVLEPCTLEMPTYS